MVNKLIKTEAEEIRKQGAIAIAKIQTLNAQGIKIIAEKVETHEQFERFKAMGVKLFQAYFLARPEILRHRYSNAINYMGHVEIKKFIALLAFANMRGETPKELLIKSLVRARFCSLMSVELELSDNPPTRFLLGLFSMIDALLDQAMEIVVEKLHVGQGCAMRGAKKY
jgi:EAL and modified HD-GYP domain-containing signal transduction protein